MTPEQAITQIEHMGFRPGWTLHATQNILCDPDQVYVWADLRTVDTSYRGADRGEFTRTIRLQPDCLISVRDLDEAGLCYAILTQLVRPTDDHEDREFLQVRRGDRWYSPLHPHTAEGERAWSDAQYADVRSTLREAAR